MIRRGASVSYRPEFFFPRVRHDHSTVSGLSLARKRATLVQVFSTFSVPHQRPPFRWVATARVRGHAPEHSLFPTRNTQVFPPTGRWSFYGDAARFLSLSPLDDSFPFQARSGGFRRDLTPPPFWQKVIISLRLANCRPYHSSKGRRTTCGRGVAGVFLAE